MSLSAHEGKGDIAGKQGIHRISLVSNKFHVPGTGIVSYTSIVQAAFHPRWGMTLQ